MIEEQLLLYHTGYSEIHMPDVHYGRKNADFGQGFYATRNGEFAGRWAKERKDFKTVLNTYLLETKGLKIYEFKRDTAWFDYIFNNRIGKEDPLADMDLIIGPIANDTIYDTLGIISSGFLKREEALELLLIGPEYEQVAVKSEKAVSQLTWMTARTIDVEEIRQYREIIAQEQAEYMKLFAEKMEQF